MAKFKHRPQEQLKKRIMKSERMSYRKSRKDCMSQIVQLCALKCTHNYLLCNQFYMWAATLEYPSKRNHENNLPQILIVAIVYLNNLFLIYSNDDHDKLSVPVVNCITSLHLGQFAFK